MGFSAGLGSGSALAHQRVDIVDAGEVHQSLHSLLLRVHFDVVVDILEVRVGMRLREIVSLILRRRVRSRGWLR